MSVLICSELQGVNLVNCVNISLYIETWGILFLSPTLVQNPARACAMFIERECQSSLWYCTYFLKIYIFTNVEIGNLAHLHHIQGSLWSRISVQYIFQSACDAHLLARPYFLCSDMGNFAFKYDIVSINVYPYGFCSISSDFIVQTVCSILASSSAEVLHIERPVEVPIASILEILHAVNVHWLC